MSERSLECEECLAYFDLAANITNTPPSGRSSEQVQGLGFSGKHFVGRIQGKPVDQSVPLVRVTLGVS